MTEESILILAKKIAAPVHLDLLYQSNFSTAKTASALVRRMGQLEAKRPTCWVVFILAYGLPDSRCIGWLRLFSGLRGW